MRIRPEQKSQLGSTATCGEHWKRELGPESLTTTSQLLSPLLDWAALWDPHVRVHEERQQGMSSLFRAVPRQRMPPRLFALYGTEIFLKKFQLIFRLLFAVLPKPNCFPCVLANMRRVYRERLISLSLSTFHCPVNVSDPHSRVTARLGFLCVSSVTGWY